MLSFFNYLEAAAIKEPDIGIGGGGIDIPDDDDDGDDDDFENGPWGWNTLQKKFGLALHHWARLSPDCLKIKNLYIERLFLKPYKEEMIVFPRFVQVMTEWLLEITTWNDLDDQIEAILKRSDLYKPLQIKQEELWNVVDKGAVFDFVTHILLITFTGHLPLINNSLHTETNSQLDKAASFAMWSYIRKDWQKMEEEIKWAIIRQHSPYSSRLQIELHTDGRSFRKPTGVSRIEADEGHQRLWAKGICQCPYTINDGPNDIRYIDPNEEEDEN